MFHTKKFTSSSDFITWLAYFAEKKRSELALHKKEEWYWAQIAYEVYRANTQMDLTARNNATIKDFLMEFKVESELDTEEAKAKKQRLRMMNAKLFFSCLTGVGTEPLGDGDTEATEQSSKPTGDGGDPAEV